MSELVWIRVRNFVLLLGIAILALFLRSDRIDVLNSFVDEAGNILVALDDTVHAWVMPGEIGRPLLSYYFRGVVAIEHFFPSQNILTLARLQSASIGFLTTIVLFCLGHRLGGAVGAIVFSSLWATCPLSVLHERLALQDPFNSFCLSAILLAITFLPSENLSHTRWKSTVLSLIVGIFFALGCANKISFIGLVPTIFGLLLYHRRRSGSVISMVEALMLSVSFSIVFLFFYSSENILRTRLHIFGFVPSRISLDTAFLMTLGQGFNSWVSHMVEYCGLPFLAFFAVAILFSVLIAPEMRNILLFLIIQIVVSAIMFRSIFYGRYLLPDLIGVFLFITLLLSRRGRGWLSGPVVKSSLILILLSIEARWVFQINYASAHPLSNFFTDQQLFRGSDYRQYTVGFPSGRRLPFLLNHIREISAQSMSPIIVFTEPHFYPSLYGLKLALRGDSSVIIHPVRPSAKNFPLVVQGILTDYQRQFNSKPRILVVEDPVCLPSYPEEYCYPFQYYRHDQISYNKLFEYDVESGKIFAVRLLELQFSSKHPDCNTRVEGFETVDPDGLIGPIFETIINSHSLPLDKVSFRIEQIDDAHRVEGIVSICIGDRLIQTFLAPKDGLTVRGLALPQDQTVADKMKLRIVSTDWRVVNNPYDLSCGYYNANRVVSYRFKKMSDF